MYPAGELAVLWQLLFFFYGDLDFCDIIELLGNNWLV